MRYKTLEDLIASNKAFLTPVDVRGVLGCSDQQVRICAREAPELLGFPIVIMGSRVKIPRIPFLRFCGVDVRA